MRRISRLRTHSPYADGMRSVPATVRDHLASTSALAMLEKQPGVGRAARLETLRPIQIPFKRAAEQAENVTFAEQLPQPREEVQRQLFRAASETPSALPIDALPVAPERDAVPIGLSDLGERFTQTGAVVPSKWRFPPSPIRSGLRSPLNVAEAQSSGRASAGRSFAGFGEIGRRELVARIELDDDRLAESMSDFLADQIAARETKLVEKIQTLVERKLTGARRAQTQRVRTAQAII